MVESRGTVSLHVVKGGWMTDLSDGLLKKHQQCPMSPLPHDVLHDERNPRNRAVNLPQSPTVKERDSWVR